MGEKALYDAVPDVSGCVSKTGTVKHRAGTHPARSTGMLIVVAKTSLDIHLCGRRINDLTNKAAPSFFAVEVLMTV
jgi:hypothetical protein